MKKIINTILALGFMAAVCSMFSSCIILLDDEMWDVTWDVSYEEPVYNYAKVKVENTCEKYGSEAAYIQKVYYRAHSSDEWQVAWDCGTGNPLYADSNCSFKLDEGYYYFCARVVYPNLSSQYNYYDDYYTDTRYLCSNGSTIKLRFDGEDLYKK